MPPIRSRTLVQHQTPRNQHGARHLPDMPGHGRVPRVGRRAQPHQRLPVAGHMGRQAVRPDEPAEKGTRMNDIDIDVNVTAWKIGLVIIMRGTATPTARVSHPECFGRFTALALSCDGAIRKCMRRVAMMCARHSACERLDRQEARG
nr:MAG TPA: hypothetical protein [Caudoviricetes sp.]